MSSRVAETVERQSLGLKALFAGLDPATDSAVLDLGPASGTNLTFFSELGCRVHVADLYRSLWDSDGGRPTDAATFADACSSLLPSSGDHRFDYILTWDLFNYLTQDQITAVVEPLTALCKPGAVLFSMISIRHQIASRPGSFQILEPGKLSTQQVPSNARPSPEYKEPQLLRLLPGFLVRRCFLMRHGVQEYLFEYKPVSAGNQQLATGLPGPRPRSLRMP